MGNDACHAVRDMCFLVYIHLSARGVCKIYPVGVGNDACHAVRDMCFLVYIHLSARGVCKIYPVGVGNDACHAVRDMCFLVYIHLSARGVCKIYPVGVGNDVCHAICGARFSFVFLFFLEVILSVFIFVPRFLSPRCVGGGWCGFSGFSVRLCPRSS